MVDCANISGDQREVCLCKAAAHVWAWLFHLLPAQSDREIKGNPSQVLLCTSS